MKERNSINGLLIFLVYGMFALFSLFLVVIGARVYRDVVTCGKRNTAVRSSFVYLANKIRMESGSSDSIYLEERNDLNVLVLKSAESEYETLIYFYDGMLREYVGQQNGDFEPKAGEKILDVESFEMEELASGLLNLTMTDEEGTRYEMKLSIPYAKR